jgi:hypothetical protein
MTPSLLVRSLSAVQFENTFNPYADTCPVHDRAGAPKTRASVLLTMLNAAVRMRIDSIWIGRDLGYRGGRRTGLALTDDVHIQAHGQRWGIAATRPTKGQEVAERTAAVIWRILSHVETPVFLWNVFPLHPHEPDEPFSNRSHNSKEARAGEEILSELLLLLKPKRLVAIGNDAANAARRLATSQIVVQVRHPSYGGQTEFLSQMSALYGQDSRKM